MCSSTQIHIHTKKSKNTHISRKNPGNNKTKIEELISVHFCLALQKCADKVHAQIWNDHSVTLTDIAAALPKVNRKFQTSAPDIDVMDEVWENSLIFCPEAEGDDAEGDDAEGEDDDDDVARVKVRGQSSIFCIHVCLYSRGYAHGHVYTHM